VWVQVPSSAVKTPRKCGVFSFYNHKLTIICHSHIEKATDQTHGAVTEAKTPQIQENTTRSSKRIHNLSKRKKKNAVEQKPQVITYEESIQNAQLMPETEREKDEREQRHKEERKLVRHKK
jgi:arginine utilization protein RocB